MESKSNLRDIIHKLNQNTRVRGRRSKDELIRLFWDNHPRYRFFKSLTPNATLLDVGAGSGGLIFWKRWGEPKRDDIKLFAIDNKKGIYFDKYSDYQICDLDKDKIKFDIGFFDGVLMSHLLEHITDPTNLLNGIHRNLKAGGKIYIEMPTIETLHYPKRSELLAENIDVLVSNFYDDITHRQTYTEENLRLLIIDTGFKPIQAGLIENDYIQDQLFSYGLENKDPEITTYGLWLKLKWTQHIVAQK